MSLPVEKKKILKTTIFIDDELPQNVINAIYINVNNPFMLDGPAQL